MNEKYEPIKFDSWQELAKYVIDGGEVYYDNEIKGFVRINFNGVGFGIDIEKIFDCRNLYIKKQPTLEELIAIKPRLCWVWDYIDTKKEVVRINKIENGNYYNNRCSWSRAQMLTDDEIKQFLSDGE